MRLGPGRAPRCDALWHGKVYVPARYRRLRATPGGAADAYRLSVVDARRSWIRREELLEFVWA